MITSINSVVNQITNILPLENDTLEEIRHRLSDFIEKKLDYNLTEKVKESFTFYLEKHQIDKKEEEISLAELLEKV